MQRMCFLCWFLPSGSSQDPPIWRTAGGHRQTGRLSALGLIRKEITEIAQYVQKKLTILLFQQPGRLKCKMQPDKSS